MFSHRLATFKWYKRKYYHSFCIFLLCVGWVNRYYRLLLFLEISFNITILMIQNCMYHQYWHYTALPLFDTCLFSKLRGKLQKERNSHVNKISAVLNNLQHFLYLSWQRVKEYKNRGESKAEITLKLTYPYYPMDLLYPTYILGMSWLFSSWGKMYNLASYLIWKRHTYTYI